MTAKDAAEQESFGPAMQACREDEREFVIHAIQGKPYAECARLAGWGKPDSSAATMARIGFRISHRPRVIDAIIEEGKKVARTAVPKAAQAVNQILDNQHHKDRARTALAILERVDPTVQRQEIEVTHTINHEQEAIEQLRTLKALNVAHEKLIEIFGSFGLERLEKKLQLEHKSDVIDVEFAEVPRDPDAAILGE